MALSTLFVIGLATKFGWLMERGFELTLLVSALVGVFILFTILSIRLGEKTFMIRNTYFHAIDFLTPYLVPATILFLVLSGIFFLMQASLFLKFSGLQNIVGVIFSILVIIQTFGALMAFALAANRREDFEVMGLFESKRLGINRALLVIFGSALIFGVLYYLLPWPFISGIIISTYIGFRL